MGLPPEFWQSERDNLLALLLPFVEEIAIAGTSIGIDRLASVGIAIDPGLPQAQAAAWARQYTDALLDDVVSVTQGSVGQIVSNWLETPGATRGELERRLSPVLANNAARASSIGVTEVTRAVTQGEYIAYEQAGIALPPVFAMGNTSLRFGPSLHPNCRCWPRVVRLADNSWVVVWSTNRDELVCQRNYETPFGTVAGCRALHNVVLSDGPYLGMSLSEARAVADG